MAVGQHGQGGQLALRSRVDLPVLQGEDPAPTLHRQMTENNALDYHMNLGIVDST